MDLTIEELSQIRVYCKNPRCAGARAGDPKYICPTTNPSVACRLCDQPFDRAKWDKAIVGLGYTPGAVKADVITYKSLIKGDTKRGDKGGKNPGSEKNILYINTIAL